MTPESLQNYLSMRLPLGINTRQQIRLLRTVFGLVFVSSIIIHLLAQQDETLVGMLIHALLVGVIYTVGISMVIACLYVLRNRYRETRVWHVWLISMAVFIVGYYFLPFDELLGSVMNLEADTHLGPTGFLRLLPVWFLVTYLFIQPYLSDGLKKELERLRHINSSLQDRSPSSGNADERLITFESGKTVLTLKAGLIQNIVVEDHYCYVHHQTENGFAKTALAMPLREVIQRLPSNFIQAHRSHVVNQDLITAIRRKNRNIRLILDSGFEVPVSRQRLNEVLPLFQKPGTD